MKWRRPLTRDLAIRTIGFLGIGYETVFTRLDRPTLLIIFLGMTGLPSFLIRDERRHRDDDDPAKKDGES